MDQSPGKVPWWARPDSPEEVFHSASSSTDFEFRSDEHEACSAQVVRPSIELPVVDRSVRTTKSCAVTPHSPQSDTEEIQNHLQFQRFQECLQVYEREKAKADRALLRTVRNGNTEEATALLNGTLPEYTTGNVFLRTTLNDSLLHVVCRSGNAELCQVLMNHGALQDPKPQNDEGQTPLHIACQLGHCEIVKLLVRAGANLSIADNEGNTPLHTAALAHHFSIAKFLRLSGADASLRNDQGRTAAECQAMKTLSDLRRAYKMPVVKVPPRPSLPIRRELPVPKASDFHITSLLGKGSFGEVYVAREKTTGKKYALKVMKKTKVLEEKMTKYAFTERNVLSRMRNPFIVGLHSAFQTVDDLFLVLDYCPGGDLGKYLSREKKFEESRARMYVCEMLLAIEALHEADVIYRDLKPDNIVLSADGHAVLTDFGLAKEGVTDNHAARSFCGSMGYLAPEILKRQGHGKAADWYMLGILLYELLTGVLPFFSRDKDLFMRNIEKGPLTFPDYISPSAKSLMNAVCDMQLLCRNPDQRLGSRGSEEIKQHQFFAGVVWGDVLSKELRPPKPLSASLFAKPVHIVQSRAQEEEDERKVQGWEYVRDPAAQ